MRKLIVAILATAASLFATSYLIKGFVVNPTASSYLVAAIVLLIMNGLLLPLIKLLMLPINLLTLGLFRWLANVFVIYLFDLLYGGVQISAYDFTGFSTSLIAFPPGHISLFWTLVLSSLTFSLSYNLISGLLRSDE